MKKILLSIGLFLVLAVSAASQSVNYHRLGGVWGAPEPFIVVGVDLFEFSPGMNLWAETVTYTSFDAQTAYAGFGARKDWLRINYTVSAGLSIVTEVGVGWNNWSNVRAAANIGVKF